MKKFELTFIFVYFILRENKIRNKTLRVTPFERKSMVMKTESKSKGQVTYFECTMGQHSPLSPKDISTKQVEETEAIDL